MISEKSYRAKTFNHLMQKIKLGENWNHWLYNFDFYVKHKLNKLYEVTTHPLSGWLVATPKKKEI